MSQAISDDEDAGRILERSARLRAIVTSCGGATAVSKVSGIPAQTIQNYMGGRDMKADALIALAAACKVALLWLATGNGPKEENDLAAQSSLAGFGSSLYEPANFLGFTMLLITCQEWHSRVNAIPTLAEVFEWIGPLYPKALKLEDRKIELRDTFP